MTNDNIEKIKSNLTIVEVISDYLKLERSGSSFKAKCPFHNEKTASFYVSPDKGIYKCFGCGKSGDIFSFICDYEGISFSDALKKLATKAGVTLQYFSKKDEKEISLKEKIEKINAITTFFWQKELYANKEALNYLKKRGINKETLIKFKIGFAPNDWNKTHEFLKKKGFTDDEILLSGITKKNENGNIYDRFRNRIIFPIFSNNNKVIAFSGRDFSNSNKVAKYLNSPVTLVFDKSSELYGFNFAKEQIRRQNYVIITEGQFDIVLSQQNNFINTVATSGTSLTEKHLKKIKNFTSNVIFAFDSDNAGINSAFRGTKLAISLGFTVKIVKIPNKKDPADILSDNNIGKKEWSKIIASSKDFLIFFSDRILNSDLSFEAKVEKMEEDILPLLSKIKDPIILEKYLKNIAEGFGVSEKTIILAMENSIKSENKEKINNKDEKELKKVNLIKNNTLDIAKNMNLLDNKSKSTIIWSNKKDKILNRICKIYLLQEKNQEIGISYKNEEIKKKILDFLSKEEFEKIIEQVRRDFKNNQWRKEDILIEDNILEVELKQLFIDFSNIFNKEKIKELQKKMIKYNFLNDVENINKIRKEISEIITKLK